LFSISVNLIACQTGKEAYDASLLEDTGLTKGQSSIFDGLRGDLEGYALACKYVEPS